MSSSKRREPYLARYRSAILSRLREIDIFIKTKPAPYSKEDVLAVLDMGEAEFDKISSALGIGCLRRSLSLL